jgi:hypothetical protein
METDDTAAYVNIPVTGAYPKRIHLLILLEPLSGHLRIYSAVFQTAILLPFSGHCSPVL